jgi:signal transduction histidine kinase
MGHNKDMTIDKRTALRAGFGCIIGLLVLSTVMAYRVQEGLSRRSFEIHRRYVQHQELLTNLRRDLWLAGIAARDYFINPADDRAAQFSVELKRLRRQADTLIAELEGITGRHEALDKLQQRFDDLWSVLDSPLPNRWDERTRYAFIQQEIVPRRDAAGGVLRELEKANHASLTESDREFTATRTAAARRLLVLLGASLLAGIVVVVFSLRHSEHLERQAAARFLEVSEAKAQLEKLSARLMEIQEEERTRLSRELHDEIVQNLAVLKIEITQAQTRAEASNPRLAEHLSRARELAERTVRSVRDISLLLRPSLLDDLGLGPALQWLSEDFSRRTGVPCEFSETDLDEGLPDSVKTCVYRVTQEALRNCEKHSRATLVKLRVKQQRDQLTVDIEDNGVGMASDHRRAPANLGVLGMRERAAALGGVLSMDSRPGGGIRVRLWLPLSPEITPLETKRMETHA